MIHARSVGSVLGTHRRRGFGSASVSIDHSARIRRQPWHVEEVKNIQILQISWRWSASWSLDREAPCIVYLWRSAYEAVQIESGPGLALVTCKHI